MHKKIKRIKVMKCILLTMSGVFLVILCMCHSNEIYIGGDKILKKDRHVFVRQLKKMSKGKYEIDLSSFCDRFYYEFHRPSSYPEKINYYIELPKLPGGLFFWYRYNHDGGHYEPFPGLQHLGSIKTNLYLENILIEETYIYEDFIVIRPANEERFIQVLFEPSLVFDVIEAPGSNYKMKYTFYENLSSEYLDTGTAGVRRLKKRTKDTDMTEWASIFRGIISAEIIYIDLEPFIAGETIYCPFSFSLASEDLIFYKDTNEFNNFINKSNEPEKFHPVSFGYYEDLDKRIGGKKRIIYYDVTYPVMDE